MRKCRNCKSIYIIWKLYKPWWIRKMWCCYSECGARYYAYRETWINWFIDILPSHSWERIPL